MRITRQVSFAVAFALLASAAITATATAQDVGSFYKGKTVTVAVGFSAGGGFDLYARLVARHIGDHIPGKPTAIVSNVPGAASLKAVQSLQVGPKDGTQIVAFNPGLISQSIIEPDKVSFRFTTVSFLGSVTADVPVCYAWGATGIKTFDDLMKLKGKVFNLGATAPGTTSYIQGALLKNLFHAPIKQITGYPGSDEQKVAMERGEIDGACGSWDSIPADWVEGKKFYPLVRYSKAAPDYVQPTPPFIGDLADPEQKKALAPILAVNDMYRPFIVAKDIPAERLKALRDAFWATTQDKAFLAEAKKGGRNIDGPMKGEDVEAIVADIYATAPEVVAKASEAVK
ncbi:MAG: Bug family tripartite tricarboxylate transporter substrate binding protein [Gemmatimonas sp.]